MAKGKSVKPSHVGSISDTALTLINRQIDFSIGYPSTTTAVFSVEGNLNQDQLRTVVELGGILNDRKFRILITEDAG
jgi:hypothetical protein